MVPIPPEGEAALPPTGPEGFNQRAVEAALIAASSEGVGSATDFFAPVAVGLSAENVIARIKEKGLTYGGHSIGNYLVADNGQRIVFNEVFRVFDSAVAEVARTHPGLAGTFRIGTDLMMYPDGGYIGLHSDNVRLRIFTVIAGGGTQQARAWGEPDIAEEYFGVGSVTALLADSLSEPNLPLHGVKSVDPGGRVIATATYV